MGFLKKLLGRPESSLRFFRRILWNFLANPTIFIRV